MVINRSDDWAVASAWRSHVTQVKSYARFNCARQRRRHGDKEQSVRFTASEEEEEEATTLLQFQHQLLREQDEELTDLSNHVENETYSHSSRWGVRFTRLLDDFNDGVEHRGWNLKRIASSARRLFERIGKSNFSLGCCLAALVFMLIVLIALSILKVEGKFHPIFTEEGSLRASDWWGGDLNFSVFH